MRGAPITKPRPAASAAALALAMACIALMAALLAPAPASARELTAPTRPDGTVMTVSDDVTRIHVDKLDAATHDAVKGAKMQILVKDTGEVVDEWTTDGTTHAFEKGLDVEVAYILREIEAPEGYEKIADVEFFANEMEGTGITIVGKPAHAELTDGYKVAVYEPHEEIVREVVEERELPPTTVTTTPKTGDAAPAAALGALALAAAAAMALALVKRKGE